MKKSLWLYRTTLMSVFLLISALLIHAALYSALSALFPELTAFRFALLYSGIMLFLLYCFRRIRSAAPYPIRCIGAYGMGVFIALSMVAALSFILPLPPWMIALMTLLLCIYGFLHPREIKVKHYSAPILNAPFRLVLISDVHLGSVGSEERLPKLIERINEQNADLVCIAGDMIDNYFPAIRTPAQAAALLSSIKSRHGVYACLGNHDAGNSAADMEAFMGSAGIRVLKEAYETVGPLQLLGRLDEKPHGNYVNLLRRNTEELLRENPRPELPLVVLDHNPAVIPQYDGRCSLLLCGHTHNGQIFPGNLVVRAINICGYGYARRDENSPHIVVSSGAGTWGPPMRIGTDCEIAVIELGQ